LTKPALFPSEKLKPLLVLSSYTLQVHSINVLVTNLSAKPALLLSGKLTTLLKQMYWHLPFYIASTSLEREGNATLKTELLIYIE
jgi:hypothetical protein